MNEKRIQLQIGGMTCVNCQSKIEKGLLSAKGIISARVSYAAGTAQIAYDGDSLSPDGIVKIINALGYTALTSNARQRHAVLQTACTLAVIVSLYVLLQATGVLNMLAPSRLADTGIGYGMLFVIGLITSVHCVAMCGGINLSQSLPGNEASGGRRMAAFLPALAYNLGRVVSYTAVGFALGLAGSLLGGAQVGLPMALQGALKMLAGVFMVIMGANMLGLFPALRRFTLRPPAFLARKLGSKRSALSQPFLVGLLNGFMPCGPLQSMWLVALASGGALAGTASMLLFSLGTVPLMLGLGSVVAALGKRFTHQVMQVGAVLVVVLGLAMLSQGGALTGWLPADLLLCLLIALCAAGLLLSLPAQTRAWKGILRGASLTVVIGSYFVWRCAAAPLADGTADSQTTLADGMQVINSTLSPGRYPSITVQAGVPVKWIIDAPEGSVNGCNYRMLIQDYGVEHTFHTGENIIEFTPQQAGTVRYSCWMGMIRGNIFVDDGQSDADAISLDDITAPVKAQYSLPAQALAVASRKEGQNGNSYQEVEIRLTDSGFDPAIVVVQKNLITLWNVDNQSSSGKEEGALLAPYYAAKLPLGQGLNGYSLYPSESFDVSTDDHRFFAYVKVVDDIGQVDGDAIREEAASLELTVYPEAMYESAGGSSCCGN
ncbi:MAG: sulfite exporter TauE/SafE family protein [Eubacteriales bacterium]|nr:sulfite exporter TauE/SafE family protein [Eubacteriales bacterium]